MNNGGEVKLRVVQKSPSSYFEVCTNDTDSGENKTGKTLVLSIIHLVEAIRLPPKCFRRSGDGVPLFTNIERVIYGTQPAAEVVAILGVNPPRYLFYMLSGFVCDLIQFLIDLSLHLLFRIEDASVCWGLGFALSIVFRHSSHRYLVFGDYVGGYYKSLGRMYLAYSIIIFLSTTFNVFMTRFLHLEHYIAWIVTLLWTGIVNYFILKKIWSFGGSESTKDYEKTAVEEPEENGSGTEMRPLESIV